MAITPATVKNIAHLARLAVDEKEIAQYCAELSTILEWVEQMNQTDTSNIAPMAHPLDIAQPLREDKVTEPEQRNVFQAIAPKVEAGLYLVPKVIE